MVSVKQKNTDLARSCVERKIKMYQQRLELNRLAIIHYGEIIAALNKENLLIKQKLGEK
jgi:hypothetical protein